MNPSNLILQNWDEQCEVFTSKLEIVRRRPVRKAAHDMRVSIKKLRAFLQLGNEVTSKGNKHELDSTLLLFRVAGKHRDVEISIILSQKHLKQDQVCSPAFMKILRAHFKLGRERTQETARLPHEKELAALSEWMHGSLDPVTDKVLSDKIEPLVRERIEELKKLVKDFDENAHEIRKLLKQLYYWVKYCSANPVFNRKEIKILDDALISLGNAQDYFVLHNKLKDFRKEYLVKQTDEFEAAKKLEKISKDSQEELIKNAKEKTELLLKRF